MKPMAHGPIRTGLFGQAVRLVACAVIASAALLGTSAVALADSPTPQDIASYKAAHDTDPHVPLSASEQAEIAQKDQLARAHHAAAVAGSVAPASKYSSRYAGGTQQGQYASYFCGPASVSEALGIKGIKVNQVVAASLLKTNTSGTAWSGVNANVPAQYQTAYPVPDVMNYEIGSHFYHPVALPYSPSSGDVSTYISYMTFDIDYNSSYPVIGDAWEVAGGAHLWGHPQNQTIYHWFTINGYASYGSYTDYMDSATTVWSTVQPYNWNFPSSTLVTILGGRGYVW